MDEFERRCCNQAMALKTPQLVCADPESSMDHGRLLVALESGAVS
jgi:hypothetical protein